MENADSTRTQFAAKPRCAAETDALGAEQLSLFRIAWNIGVGADAETAAQLVGPLHESGEVVRFRIGIARLALALVNFAERAVERNPIAFFEYHLLAFKENGSYFFIFVNRHGGGSDHTRPAHAASHDGGMAGKTADCRQDAL